MNLLNQLHLPNPSSNRKDTRMINVNPFFLMIFLNKSCKKESQTCHRSSYAGKAGSDLMHCF